MVMDKEQNSNVPKYIKSINIYQWIFSIFGLTLPPLLNQRSSVKSWMYFLMFILYLSYCTAVAAIAIYTCYKRNAFILQASSDYQLDGITKILSYIQNNALAVVHITMGVKTIWNYDDLREITQLIGELEFDMTSQCQRCFKNSTITWKLLRTSGLSLFVSTGTLIYLNYFLVANTTTIEYRTVVLFSIAAMQLKCVEYGIYIQLIYEFIDCLTQTLGHLKEDIENCPRPALQNSLWSLQQQLMKNQLLLNRVLLLVNRVGQYFAWPLLLIFFYNGETILCTVNWTYIYLTLNMQGTNLFIRLLFILILLLNMFMVCYLTQKCIQKYQFIGALIHNINLSSDDYAILMRLREYSMQMMHQKLVFTCNGYMDIDFKSYGKMLLVISSYVIILVQFKMGDAEKGTMLATQHIFGKNA